MNKTNLVLITMLFGVSFNGFNQTAENTFRENNRMTVQPAHIYKVQFNGNETKKEISARFTDAFNSADIFFPIDTILIIQSENILDSELINKIIQKGDTKITGFSYSYLNHDLLIKKDSIINSENKVYKKH